MLQLCGCDLSDDDADRLVALLEDDVTVASDEAAAAIRFAGDAGGVVNALDRDIRDAIVHVLAEPPTLGLAALRDSLAGGRA